MNSYPSIPFKKVQKMAESLVLAGADLDVVVLVYNSDTKTWYLMAEPYAP